MTSAVEDHFALLLDVMRIRYEREYRAIAGRKLRWDFYIPAVNLLVEIQGGTWMRKGGHNTGVGIRRDCEKVTLATLHGYRVMLFTTADVMDDTAIDAVIELVNKEAKDGTR